MNDSASHNHPNPSAGRIVVVGPCAAGKTTLVHALCDLGYDAHACAQEHSGISALWRHTHPAVLIALQVDLGSLRRRRGEHWPAWLYDLELRRLENAYASADLIIDTSTQEPGTILQAAVSYLVNHPG